MDVGRDEETGKRKQRTYTFSRRKDAEAELARIGHTLRTGEFVDRSKVTVIEVLDSYLAEAKFERELNTLENYRHALEPVRERLGQRRAQSVTRQDVEDLRDWLLTSGRKRGGKSGTGLGPRSVRLTLGRLSAAFDLAIRDRILTVNPVQHVKLPKPAEREPATWSAAEVRAFLAGVAEDRLHAAWRLTLYGLRRAEVCGLRWDGGVDLAAGTLTIDVTRPVINGKPIMKKPKSARGTRTLPLTEQDVAALQVLHDRQVTEAMEAGETYAASGYVVADELGQAVNPERYTEEFHRLRKRAGLPRITLHEGRHTANSLMAAAGVPDHIRAAWCGHTVIVNKQTYTHARPEDMAVALAALDKINKAV